MKIYIYLITNKLNGHMYIGQTCDLKKRWNEHSRPSRNKTVVEKAFNKYGADNFTLEILETVEKSIANEREIYWIEKYGLYENPDHYNCHVGGSMQHGEFNPMAKFVGEDCPNSKLTIEWALQIYNEYKNDLKTNANKLAKKHKLSKPTVLEIVKGKHWATKDMESIFRKHIKKIKISKPHTSTKITKDIGFKILEYFNEHQYLLGTYNYFKDIYNVSYRTIQRICLRQHWSTKGSEV